MLGATARAKSVPRFLPHNRPVERDFRSFRSDFGGKYHETLSSDLNGKSNVSEMNHSRRPLFLGSRGRNKIRNKIRIRNRIRNRSS